jgi:type II secretory pathway component PulK
MNFAGYHMIKGHRQRGTVLVATMWIVLVLAGLVVVFARSMRVEAIASANRVASVQAAAVARGALQYVIAKVDGLNGAMPLETDLQSEAVKVGAGYFWLLKTDFDSDVSYSFGLTGEAAKVSLNTADADMLMALPGMTDELASSIVDWRDPDDTPTGNGAESDYYMLLPDPYYCKNGPFESVEELLLVKGCTTQILYGEDTNINGVLDANENDGATLDPPDNADGHLDHGIIDFVTAYSVEPNTNNQGEARANVNDARGTTLVSLLQQTLSVDRFAQVLPLVRSGRPFRNALDFHFRSGLTAPEFALLADNITTQSGGGALRGLIDVSHAPRPVLLCLPGLTDTDADSLIAKRSASNADTTNIAWVADALPREKAIPVGDFITARTFQYTADIVAVSGNGRAYKRYRAIIDARNSPPRVIRWQDLTSLGWPLSADILQTLRSGRQLESGSTISALSTSPLKTAGAK